MTETSLEGVVCSIVGDKGLGMEGTCIGIAGGSVGGVTIVGGLGLALVVVSWELDECEGGRASAPLSVSEGAIVGDKGVGMEGTGTAITGGSVGGVTVGDWVGEATGRTVGGGSVSTPSFLPRTAMSLSSRAVISS
jgi:hypothetical protein